MCCHFSDVHLILPEAEPPTNFNSDILQLNIPIGKINWDIFFSVSYSLVQNGGLLLRELTRVGLTWLENWGFGKKADKQRRCLTPSGWND